jgi:NADH-quinone oxidoreductase subunit L
MLKEIGESVGDWLHFGLHAFANPVFWIMALGVFTSWTLYIWKPHLPDLIDAKLKPCATSSRTSISSTSSNEKILAFGSVLVGKFFWKIGDQAIIDGAIIGGSTGFIGWTASVIRRIQSGFLYSYAFWMVIGLAVMLGWFVTRA